MPETPLISIIVPVYKTEKYLPRCINSILNQTYESFELILVDDGSPDSCGKICDESAIVDNRIRVLHTNNCGVSQARNSAMQMAEGEYFYFVDSDDWVSKNGLTLLVDLLRKHKAQLVMGSYDLRELRVRDCCLRKEVIDLRNGNFYDMVTLINGMNSSCGKLFSRELLNSNSIKFDPHVKYGEDRLFVYEYLGVCNRICTTDAVVYHYNKLNEGSATNKIYPEMEEWLLKCQRELSRAFDQLGMPVETKNILLADRAMRAFVGVVSVHVSNGSQRQAIMNIRKSLKLFEPWLFLDTGWQSGQYFAQSLLQAIVDREETSIYLETRAMLSSHSFKRRAKGALLKNLGPILEITRDGLIPVFN